MGSRGPLRQLLLVGVAAVALAGGALADRAAGSPHDRWVTMRKAYVGVLGYVRYPEFASARIDYRAVVFHPLYGWDLSSLKFAGGG
ncbi:MAG TPA: hypothetical protein VGI50_11420 [Solirubrobacteraceae bacterium]|jgi:hypothetical protein